MGVVCRRGKCYDTDELSYELDSLGSSMDMVEQIERDLLKAEIG